MFLKAHRSSKLPRSFLEASSKRIVPRSFLEAHRRPCPSLVAQPPPYQLSRRQCQRERRAATRPLHYPSRALFAPNWASPAPSWASVERRAAKVVWRLKQPRPGSFRPRPTRLSTATGQAIRRSRIKRPAHGDFLFIYLSYFRPVRGASLGAARRVDLEIADPTFVLFVPSRPAGGAAPATRRHGRGPGRDAGVWRSALWPGSRRAFALAFAGARFGFQDACTQYAVRSAVRRSSYARRL